MSGSEFDRLTKALAARASRRSVFKGLVAAAAAAVASRFGSQDAEAVRCQGAGGACSNPQGCCQTMPSTCLNGRCCPNTAICQVSANSRICCQSGTVCVGGACCPAAKVCQTANGPVCCVGEQSCLNGVCCATAQACRAPSGARVCCPAGQSCVNGACCTNSQVCKRGRITVCCPAGQGCVNGTCGCPPGSRSCGGGVCGECCVDAHCDDGNPCTLDICDLITHTCRHEITIGIPCTSGTPGSQPGTCQADGSCNATPVSCAPPDQCHEEGLWNSATDQCEYATKPNGTPCDDGNLCTQSDTCQAGVCVAGTAVVCQAQDQCHDVGTCDPASGSCSNPTKADGAPCDDGNLCTQTDSCQAGVCVGTNPVACAALDECHDAGVCDPRTGLCSNPPRPNGSPCSDANACTNTDTCQSGVCVPGTDVVCAPPGACQQAGVCNPDTGQCEYLDAPDDTPCDAGNLCTIGDTCQSGECVAGTQHTCPAADQCHEAGVCNPVTGDCEYDVKPDGTPCDDGNACTQLDTCQAGACIGSNPVVCAPAGQCQEAGICNPASGLCAYADKPDGAACDDGDACTQTDTCQTGVCVGGNPVVCVALDECHAAGSCDPANGQCSNPAKPNGAPCSDGNACTETDTCQDGLCTAGTTVVCPPPGPCQAAGICNPTSGQCAYDNLPDGTLCGTPVPCMADSVCQAGLCVPGQPLVCPSPDACHEQGVCDPATGECTFQAKADGTLCGRDGDCTQDICLQGTCELDQPKDDGTPCDDGDACTQTGTCQAGVCVGGDPVACAALDECHDAGTCDPLTGLCTDPAKPNGTPCSDQNVCTETDTCQDGVCTPGSEVVCPPPSVCQQGGICNPDTGQCEYSNAPDGTPCEDGNICTLNDTCQEGVCVAGTPIVCPPLDQCHEDGVCDPATGECRYDLKEDGTPCDDGNACTQNDICLSGSCIGIDPVVCPPADECQDEGVCNPATGECGNASLPDGTPCDDGDACTQIDTCVAGACVGGDPVACEALDECHEPGVCDPQSGACSNPPAPDGTPCEDGDACTLTDTCQAGVCTPGTDVVCAAPGPCEEEGICNPTTGECEYAPKADGTSCDDEDPCTENDFCQSGVCTPGTPIVCPSFGSCYEDGICDAAQSGCVYDLKPDGTLCGQESNCLHDICNAGVCLLDQPRQDGTSCDDGDLCTENDTCQGGVCTPGISVVCDDSDPCTVDTCDSLTGQCVFTITAGLDCTDPDPCHEDGVCQPDGSCLGTPVVCDNGDACSEGVCDPETGECVFTALSCEPEDLCHTAECVPTLGCVQMPKDCSDGDECVNGFCATATGTCIYEPREDGSACDSDTGICQGGVCRHSLGESCTTTDDCIQDGIAICDGLVCCHPEWFECTFHTDCCTGLCQDAQCRQP